MIYKILLRLFPVMNHLILSIDWLIQPLQLFYFQHLEEVIQG